MKTNLQPGKYVVAVSGGVDSVVLLDLLCQQKGLDIVVAHFDHGMREDSIEDKNFVEDLARQYGLEFEAGTTSLGPDASEEKAREVRYNFLFGVLQERGAQAIVTAHHQDDVLETIIMNLSRGSGRKGLAPMNRPGILRPLLDYSKAEIVDYAKAHNLQWREDSTNLDIKYLRNYVRINIVPKMSEPQKSELLALAKTSHEHNRDIDEILDIFLEDDSDGFSREGFAVLPHAVAGEVVSHLLRKKQLNFDRKNIEKIVIELKTLSVGSKIPISQGAYFLLDKNIVRIIGPQSV